MAERKADIVYDLTTMCLEGSMAKVIGTFIAMNPLEAEDCLAAFWHKASVGNLRKYHRMITDNGVQMPAELLDESDLPDDVEELRIVVDDEEDDWHDEADELDENEDDEDDEYSFEL